MLGESSAAISLSDNLGNFWSRKLQTRISCSSRRRIVSGIKSKLPSSANAQDDNLVETIVGESALFH